MNIQDALDLSLNEEAFRIIGKEVAVETLVPRRRNASLIRIEMQEVHEDDTWHTSENPRLSSPRTPAHEKARRLHL